MGGNKKCLPCGYKGSEKSLRIYPSRKSSGVRRKETSEDSHLLKICWGRTVANPAPARKKARVATSEYLSSRRLRRMIWSGGGKGSVKVWQNAT